ncbi:MAG TPA: hypothetical protein VM677_02615 [Actinokineospora sp.]|nr:hypothetical protein [Actinokineospora sp.]
MANVVAPAVGALSSEMACDGWSRSLDSWTDGLGERSYVVVIVQSVDGDRLIRNVLPSIVALPCYSRVPMVSARWDSATLLAPGSAIACVDSSEHVNGPISSLVRSVVRASLSVVDLSDWAFVGPTTRTTIGPISVVVGRGGCATLRLATIGSTGILVADTDDVRVWESGGSPRLSETEAAGWVVVSDGILAGYGVPGRASVVPKPLAPCPEVVHDNRCEVTAGRCSLKEAAAG